LKNIQKKDDEVMADCKDKKKKGANIGWTSLLLNLVDPPKRIKLNESK
jgi:hypothetical protein